MSKDLTRNTAWNAIEAVVALVVGLLFTKVFIHMAGLALFGLYLALSLLSNYGIFALLDMGMGGAIVSYAARYISNDTEKLPKLWTFALVYYFVITQIALVLVGFVAWLKWPAIAGQLDHLGVSHGVIPLAGLLMVFALLAFPVDNFLSGFGDFGFMQKVTMGLHIARLAGTAIVLAVDKSVTAAMVVVVCCSGLRLLSLLLYLARNYRQHIRLQRFDAGLAREWFHYSMTLFVGVITGFIFNVSDKVLITAYLPIAAMANYDIAVKMHNMAQGGFSVLMSAVSPVSARYQSLNQHERQQELFIRGSTWMGFILLPPLVYATVMMGDFIRVWVGPSHVWLAPIAQLYMSYQFVHIVPALGCTMLVGMGHASRLVWPQVIAAAINLVVSWVLVQRMGLAGLIIGTLIGQLFVTIVYYQILSDALQIGWARMVRQIIVPFIKTLIAPGLLCLGLMATGWHPGLVGFIGAAFLHLAFSYGAIYLFVLNPTERQFVDRQLATLWAKGLASSSAAPK